MIDKKPAVFFDRDGVLNVDHGYTFRKQDLEWMAGAVQTIRFFNENNYQVFVITNQSGIARGYYTEDDVMLFHEFMNNELHKKGAHIDAFYYCPHHLDGTVPKYQKACTCRKPAPGMIRRACQVWSVDIENSFVIGDRSSDMEAAESAGMRGFLFESGNLYEFIKERVVPWINIKIF
ncbi:D-glycero-alpha-D-manno-heptose-1,7-bisphosphate 7-phosphatase [Pelosinus propionicus]|uniref:D,D-heptose 1,7-bisphosphate phosphatase n=1 Tax=Pelosinus propionicus DSM 13327 TaxID=1123291 RepID=A0A1I4MQP0_9FIRM|nr:HAD family hydrolase [Pelosinus propionicus]SFM05390.1 D-glycero-D-manno-heptose 1,7-bisphosphate phosphatase [Pelosinus propionicus DSM 13327]